MSEGKGYLDNWDSSADLLKCLINLYDISWSYNVVTYDVPCSCDIPSDLSHALHL